MTVPDWLKPLLAAIDVDGDTTIGRRVPDAGEIPDGVRRAAVLVLFGEGVDGPDVLLIEKSPRLRTHAGQPAFPGGGIEPGEDAAAAALREAQEETGVDPGAVDVLAVMPELWVPPSGNAVTPVIGWWRSPGEVGPADPLEVAKVARVPISHLVDPANRLQVRSPRGSWVSPAFAVAGMVVWGFTAGVLAQLIQLAGWELPWDHDRIENLPPTVPAPLDDDVLTPFAEGA